MSQASRSIRMVTRMPAEDCEQLQAVAEQYGIHVSEVLRRAWRIARQADPSAFQLITPNAAPILRRGRPRKKSAA